jgi:hypothetical protein
LEVVRVREKARSMEKTHWEAFVYFLGGVTDLAKEYIGEGMPESIADTEDMYQHMDLLEMFIQDRFAEKYGINDIRISCEVDQNSFKHNYIVATVDCSFDHRGKHYTFPVELYRGEVRYGKVADNEDEFNKVIDSVLRDIYERYTAFKEHMEARR